MATQEALFSRDTLPTAEMFAPLIADTAPADHGNNGRPPASAVIQDPGVENRLHQTALVHYGQHTQSLNLADRSGCR